MSLFCVGGLGRLGIGLVGGLERVKEFSKVLHRSIKTVNHGKMYSPILLGPSLVKLE